MARPAGLSPSNCAISDRSSPSPAVMVPSSSLAIRVCQSGRRLMPATAIFVSLATPMRSAHSISRRIGGKRRCGKLRRDIAVIDRRADMIEAALEIGPDFAADIGPAFAERKILAEIGSGRRIDHTFEQRKSIETAGQRVERMLAKELQRCVSRMRAHLLEHVTPDHQESGAGVTHARKAIHHGDMIRIVDLQYIVE